MFRSFTINGKLLHKRKWIKCDCSETTLLNLFILRAAVRGMKYWFTGESHMFKILIFCLKDE